MEKMRMVAQGGVSKATKGLNLSEDVFAGMDLTLRGGNVCHREYMQAGKGREMSFIGHLRFIAKLSRGCAEMTLTRQSYWLGTRLNFFRMLGLYCTRASGSSARSPTRSAPNTRRGQSVASRADHRAPRAAPSPSRLSLRRRAHRLLPDARAARAHSLVLRVPPGLL
jgi:hypothetical protein